MSHTIAIPSAAVIPTLDEILASIDRADSSAGRVHAAAAALHARGIGFDDKVAQLLFITAGGKPSARVYADLLQTGGSG